MHLPANREHNNYRQLNMFVEYLEQPWQLDEHHENWLRHMREMRDIGAAVLWLLLVRGIVAPYFGRRC